MYLISPEILPPDFEARLDCVLATGFVSIFQLRLKRPPSEIEARTVVDLCKKYNVISILNDYEVLSDSLGFDGFHFGEEDEVLLGNERFFGVSCYNKIERANWAVESGANYVAFGAFFPTKTKVIKYVPTPKIIYDFKQIHPKTPVCAIGGINETNVSLLEYNGVKPDLIAIISGFWSRPVIDGLKVAEIIKNFTEK